MLFNSFHFLVFFPLVLFFYFLMPHKYRWLFLLGASYYFYMSWKPAYLILILVSTLIDYFAAILMERSIEKWKRKFYLSLSLFSNMGLLFVFKYFNFLNDAVKEIFSLFAFDYPLENLDLLLPVGISFYTFQTMSYTIDVYRREREPEKHLGIFALYVSFFPQLVAGPIERSTRLIPQFYKKCGFDYQRVTDGLKLMAWGFFKKLVIADRVAVLVNKVFNHPTQFEGLPLVVATVFFAIQIFCDFSGYSDIAIGSAKVLGFDLMENFKRPYYSKSISEFWKRWHISLSTWFRDYLYIPLGGNRVVKWRWYYNLFITFLISGLWHGANWTFVFWGGLNGLYLIVEIVTAGWRKSIVSFLKIDRSPIFYKCLRVGITFFLTCFAWIFFRANNLSDAFHIIGNIFSDSSSYLNPEGFIHMVKTKKLGLDYYNFNVAIIAIAFMEIIHLSQRKGSLRVSIRRWKPFMRWVAYLGIVQAIVLFGYFSEQQFIYFQF